MELKLTHTTGALPFSKTAVDFIEHYLGTDLFPTNRVAAHWGVETVLPVEFLDLYGMSTPEVQRDVFPIIEPEFYRSSANLADPDENLLEHFLQHGIHLEIDPHPLLSFEWMRFSRPDIFERPLTPQIFFSIFESNLISTTPFLDLAFYRRAATGASRLKSAFFDYVLRGAALDLSPSRWIDLDHYRETYPDVPRDAMGALIHFIQVGDADLRSPTPDFDPGWYQENYSTGAHQIDHPLYHFLRWGRFARHAPRLDGVVDTPEGIRNRRVEQAKVNFVFEPEPEKYSEAYRRARTMSSVALTRRVQSLRDSETPDGPAIGRGAGERGSRDRRVLSGGFTVNPNPAVEILVHGTGKLLPLMRTVGALVKAAPDLSGLETNGHKGVSVTVLFDQSDEEAETARKLADKVGGIGLAFQNDSTPLKTDAPAVLLVSAGAEITSDAIAALVTDLTARPDTVATAPLIVTSQGTLVTAGGMVQANGTAKLVGQGMSPDACPWARDRAVPWAPSTALLIARDALDQTGESLWTDLQDGHPVDLSMRLRQGGGQIRLVGAAQVKNRSGMVAPFRDYKVSHRILEDFSDTIEKDLHLRVIAHFFPHFSPDDVVQKFNGQGTTDWFFVSKTHPDFVGHYQPHVPRDLGFYDSRMDEVLQKQTAMARRYGVDGFLLRYYNIDGQRILGQTFEQLIAGKFQGVQHALCWDTQGLDGVVDPIEKGFSPPQQSFDTKTVDAVLQDAIAAASVDGCITVGGLPLFAVSGIDHLPDATAFAAHARQAFRDAGFVDVHLAMLSPDTTSDAFGKDPNDFGFDSVIQDAPQGLDVQASKRGTKAFRATNIKMEDYRDVAVGAFRAAIPPYVQFPGVCTGWDDTPRRRLSHRVLLEQNPATFQAWLQTAIDELDLGMIGDERLIFVNAWNNWSCGAHLEPDNAFGRSWLQAIENARHRGLAPVTGAPETRRARAGGHSGSAAILIHAYYLDVFEEMIEMMVNESLSYPLYVTCPETNVDGVRKITEAAGLDATILPSENHGRDVLPFLNNVQQIQLDGHKYLLKLHTKKSLHRSDGDMWRKELFGPFLNRQNLDRIVTAFDSSPRFGMTGPESHILPLTDHLVENQTHLSALTKRLGVDFEDALARDQFVAGTMFFARFSTLLPILKLGLNRDDFEDESGQVDGTIAHALERAFGLACRLNGREVVPLETVLGERRASRGGGRKFHG